MFSVNNTRFAPPLPKGMLVNDGAGLNVTWVKGKTQWCDTKIDGTVVYEWIGENERFYGVEGVKSGQILKGEVHAPTGPLTELKEVLEAVEKQDWSHRKLPSAGSPGEFKVKAPSAENLKEFEAAFRTGNTGGQAA